MSLSMFYACLAFPAGRESFHVDLTWNLSPQKYAHVSKHFCHDTQVMETQLLDAKYLSRTKVNIVSILVKNTNKQEEKVVLHQRHVQTLA